MSVFYQFQNLIHHRCFFITTYLRKQWFTQISSLLFKIFYPNFSFKIYFFWHTNQYPSCFPWANILKLKFKSSFFHKLWLRYSVLFLSSEWFPSNSTCSWEVPESSGTTCMSLVVHFTAFQSVFHVTMDFIFKYAPHFQSVILKNTYISKNCFQDFTFSLQWLIVCLVH